MRYHKFYACFESIYTYYEISQILNYYKLQCATRLTFSVSYNTISSKIDLPIGHMDSSKLEKAFTDAWWGRKKIAKTSRGTPVVVYLDDDKLIYKLQCNTCNVRIKATPK